MNKILVTGGAGCIGAATTHTLVSRGVDEIVIAPRTASEGTLGLWFPEKLDGRIKLVKVDISNAEQTLELVQSVRPTRIIHLGASQTPDCDAFPVQGMEVNVGGTLNLLNAAATLGDGFERLVFASSAAVYGPRAMYPAATVKEEEPLAPPNLYGVWKVAGEYLARLFQQKTGVPTVCLRLSTTYGKGRDKGKTSGSTAAMKAVALGHARGEAIPFRMPYFGRENYHYVGDVGAHFASCALDPFEGFGAFNILGKTIEVQEFLNLIKDTAASLGMGATVDLDIALDATTALFVCDLDDLAIEAKFPGLPRTALATGIRHSLESFREKAAQANR